MKNSIMPRWIVCSKCNNELRDYASFCDSCGASLVEICSECGKMELIGRAVCKTKLGEAKIKLKDFQNEAVKKMEKPSLSKSKIIVLSAVVSFIVWCCFVATSPKFNVVYFILAQVVCVYVCLLGVFIGVNKESNVRKKAELEFYEKFPIEAEILKKAKGGEKWN